MRRNRVGNRQQGDTLVEVLICILIVSMILTGAYVTTNKSSLRVRDSQERSEALKLAEAQIEQIRQNATAAAPNVFDRSPTNAFCMLDATIREPGSGDCRQDASAQPNHDASAIAYTISAKHSDCSSTSGQPDCSLFTVKVTWDDIATKTQAYQEISARLYP